MTYKSAQVGTLRFFRERAEDRNDRLCHPLDPGPVHSEIPRGGVARVVPADLVLVRRRILSLCSDASPLEPRLRGTS